MAPWRKGLSGGGAFQELDLGLQEALPARWTDSAWGPINKQPEASKLWSPTCLRITMGR